MFRPNIIVDVFQKTNSLYTKQDTTTTLEVNIASVTIPRAVIQSVLNNLLYNDDGTLIEPYCTFNISNGKFEPYSTTGKIPFLGADISLTLINTKYLLSEEYQVNGNQLLSNGCDYTANNIVPVEYLKGVPFVEIHVSSDEVFNVLGVKSSAGAPPYSFATQYTQLPDISPYYIKSFVTGEPIDNKYFSFFNKFLPDPENPGFFHTRCKSSQWKVNSNTDPNNGLNVCPVSLKRDPSLYEEYLAQDTTNVSSIVEKILSVIGTEKCKEIQCAPPSGHSFATASSSYGSHEGFASYYSVCISYNFLKNLN